MHESTIFDASFIVLIGFLVFMGVAIKFGYRKAINSLDVEIQGIQSTLDQAAAALKSAEEYSAQERLVERQLIQEIENLKTNAEKRIQELHNQTNAEINIILDNKQNIADTTIDMMRHETILALRETLAEQAKEKLTQILLATEPKIHNTLNDQAIEKLTVVLKNNDSHSNGNSPRQAIA